MGVRIYKLDESLMCMCGHEWGDHHHGIVQNREYFDYPLTIEGCIAQEREYNQHEGYFTPRHKEKTMCTCEGFKPRAHNVQKIVDAWNKKYDEMRKRDAGRQ